MKTSTVKTAVTQSPRSRVWRSTALVAVALAFIGAGSAQAQSTWVSSSGTTWDTVGNWNNGVPTSSGRATFATASGTANP